MIRLRGLDKSYVVGGRPLHVLKSLDLDVEQGEFVSIMGSSGSGKSTLLNVLGILDGYDAGTYHLGDVLVKDLSERRAAEYRNRFVGFVFQSFHLLPFKTATENVALPLYYAGVSRRDRLKRAAAMIERVGLADRADHFPTQLSGGQKQRVAIARALVTSPRILLADEPTGALDSATTEEILDLLAEVHRAGTTLVVVTHESGVADRTSRVIELRDGRVERVRIPGAVA
ncbi:MAG: ABC transporter ATP-binding protein [Myxococcota bacterium]